MIDFLPVIADISKGMFKNQEYLPYILKLFDKYKSVLIDDYYPKEDSELVSYLINEINQLYPWFLVCIVDKNPIGVVWVSHWHGNLKEFHSCQIHSYIDKKYWGKVTRKATNAFLDLLFNQYNLKRVQMEIPEFNHKAKAFAKRMGFREEGIVRCATIKDGKPVNNTLLSKLKGEHINGKRQYVKGS